MAQYEDPNNSAGTLSVDKHKGAVSRSSWILLVTAMVAVSFSGAFWYQSYLAEADTTTINAKAAADQTTLAGLKSVATSVTALDTQGTHLSTVLDGQKRWENVLSNIQLHLYRKLMVTTLDVSTDGAVNLSGVTDTHDTYRSLYSSLVSSTSQQYFTAVHPVAVAVADNAAGLYPGLPKSVISFTFSLKLTPAMFLAPPAHS